MQSDCYQTPDALRSRSNSTWMADLDAYIVNHQGAHGADRSTLVSNVKSNPHSAEAWQSLMAYEETHGANIAHSLPSATGTTENSNKVSLYHIYYWATQLVPRSKNQQKEAYLRLWLGFARQQWVRSHEDARDTFKTLKNQLVGEGSAYLYHEWASLEHAAGNVSKALGIIAKGLKSDAQPSSILQHLRGEMQSGTVDLKAAGSYTETLTIDASSAAARQLQQPSTTPAPPNATALKAVSGCNKGSRRAPASCLRDGTAAPLACVRAHLPEHGGRAVTFAADVHGDTPVDREHGRHSGNACSNSAHSVARTADAHTGCLSTSSTSSRSTTSVHDGTLPFLSGTVSYKSSTTESCSMGGAEEDTISCQAAGVATGSASKPSTAPLNLQSSQGAAASSSNTATLGLKRFGFKSRALRVGSGDDTPARLPQPTADPVRSAASTAAVPAPPHAELAASACAASAGGSSAAVEDSVSDEEAATTGRKRRAGDASPSCRESSSSFETACSVKEHSKRQLGPREPLGSINDMPEAAHMARKPFAATELAVGCVAGMHRSSSSEEDSVPLVSSKLAARLAQEKGTPLQPCQSRCRSEELLTMAPSLSPAEGQLPSSLDSTPEPVPCIGSLSQPADSTPQLLASSVGNDPDSQRPPHNQAAYTAARSNTELPLQSVLGQSERACNGQAPAAAINAHEQTMPTIILTADPASTTHPRRQPSSSQKQQGVQPSRSGVTSTREPLRQLQSQQTTHSSRGLKQYAVKGGSIEDAAGLAPGCQQHQQEQVPQHGLPETQQQQQQQQQQLPPMGPPPPVSVQQQPVLRQSRPREDAQIVFVQGVRYTKLECVGRGGSSKVFKVMGPSCRIYALKRIRLAGRDEEAASGFIDEINLLNRLKNKPNIIQLVDSQVFQEEGLIYMVQEYGEIDLARLLAKHDAVRRVAAGNNASSGKLLPDTLDENFIRLYWQQMLQAVSGVHEQRIVHSDLKPANFLLVEGQLKLIDFGIAKAISGDTTSIARESQVGTLNYMSPEAILGGSNNILGGPAMKVGRPSDVWSLGCILYQMVHGRTPFADLPFLPKMHAICSPQHQVAYPALANSDLLDVMKRCLDRDPKTRITLQELLDHPFLHPNRSRLLLPARAAPMGLSEEQMKLLVSQVAAAGAAGVADIDKLTKELMQKLGTASRTTA